MNKVSTQSLLLVIVVIVAMVAILWPKTFSWLRTDTTDNTQRIAAYEKSIDSLRTAISANTLLIEESKRNVQALNDSVLLLNNRIKVNNNKLNNLKKEYDDKINSILFLTSDELEEYLTNRYR